MSDERTEGLDPDPCKTARDKVTALLTVGIADVIERERDEDADPERSRTDPRQKAEQLVTAIAPHVHFIDQTPPPGRTRYEFADSERVITAPRHHDLEVEAIGLTHAVLDGLGSAAQRRIADYLSARFATTTPTRDDL